MLRGTRLRLNTLVLLIMGPLPRNRRERGERSGIEEGGEGSFGWLGCERKGGWVDIAFDMLNCFRSQLIYKYYYTSILIT